MMLPYTSPRPGKGLELQNRALIPVSPKTPRFFAQERKKQFEYRPSETLIEEYLVTPSFDIKESKVAIHLVSYAKKRMMMMTIDAKNATQENQKDIERKKLRFRSSSKSGHCKRQRRRSVQ